MKQTNPRTVREAQKIINGTYKFMLESGYEVVSVDDYDLGWQALLRKRDVFARITRSRGEEEIYFRSGTQSPDEFTDIGTVIYAATGDKIPRWESSEPKVIERYLDKIGDYFEGEYVRDRDSLRRAEAEHQAAFSRPGALESPTGQPIGSSGGAVSAEPKRTPLLHYPLMAIILLLILGGLITLCMVLADRLFAIF